MMPVVATTLRRFGTRGAQRGQAIIETALILPLLILLLGATCDFGIFMFEREQAGSCVRSVARRAAVRDANALSVDLSPQCETAASNGLSLTPGYTTAQAGSPVTATVDFQYDPVFLDLLLPVDGWSPITNMRITATSTMRLEGQQAP
jgi:Flp pilus assembly protein TadG